MQSRHRDENILTIRDNTLAYLNKERPEFTNGEEFSDFRGPGHIKFLLTADQGPRIFKAWGPRKYATPIASHLTNTSRIYV